MLATSMEFCPACTAHGFESPLFEPLGVPGKPSSKHCPMCRAAWRWTGRRWVLMRGSRWAYSDLVQERKRRAIIEAVRSEWADELTDCASE